MRFEYGRWYKKESGSKLFENTKNISAIKEIFDELINISFPLLKLFLIWKINRSIKIEIMIELIFGSRAKKKLANNDKIPKKINPNKPASVGSNFFLIKESFVNWYPEIIENIEDINRLIKK